MAKLLEAPPLPTSVRAAKAGVSNVGSKAMWVLGAIAAVGLARMAQPYLARVPVLGAVFGAGSPSSAADAFGFGGA